ncbi:hypothetical protein Tco_1017623 [Tanacetum coccineum]|uniref:Protein TIC 214 n=1 Tax=Tanacetum coccineum TaxID=301880 RepID=A0ABQ5FTF3_9ASTR
MTEMFRLLKELTTNKIPENVLIREEAKFHVTKNINSISLTKGEEERSNRTKVTPENTKKLTETEIEMIVKEVKKMNEVENRDGNQSIETSENKEAVEAPDSQPIAYYLKHKINEKLIKGLVRKSKISFHRISDSSCITDKGVKNDIEPIAPIMTVNRLVLEWEERIKLHLKKDMKFNQLRSNNFKNKQHDPVKVEGRMDDEEEVT